MPDVRSSDLYDLKVKLVLVGDGALGKTCMLVRYVNDLFDGTLATIGVEFLIKNVEVDGTRLKLQIWDTAGQKRFRIGTTPYIRRAHGILLLYDVTYRPSFEVIRDYWIPVLEDVHVSKILVGNKCDMLDEKVVSTEEGQKLAKDLGFPFYECSAKHDVNVDEAFVGLARMAKDQLLGGVEREASTAAAPDISGGNGTSDGKRRFATALRHCLRTLADKLKNMTSK